MLCFPYALSGECAASTYPYNSIEVLLYSGCSGISGTPTVLTVNGNPNVQSVLGSDRTPHCERGKFSLAMTTEYLPVSSCNTIVVSLRAGNSADITQQTATNAATGKFSFQYIRSP